MTVPMPTIRQVPSRLFRGPSGRLHIRNRCSGGATPRNTTVVRLTQEAFEEAVRADKACRCVGAWVRAS